MEWIESYKLSANIKVLVAYDGQYWQAFKRNFYYWGRTKGELAEYLKENNETALLNELLGAHYD